MEKDDITNIERITSKFKVRYDNLEVEYKDEIIGTKLYLAINLSTLVNEMYLYKNTLVNTEDFELHCAISIMNLFAHYKHFYLTRGEVTRCVVIGYLKDGYCYNRYEQLIETLNQICDFFKDVYVIPKIYEGNYTHIVCACIVYMDSCSINKTIPRTIHIISAYNVDKQIMNCIPVKSAHKFIKELSGKIKDTSKELMMINLFKNDSFYRNCEYKSELEALLMPIGKFLNTMVCLPADVDERKKSCIKYNVSRIKDKLVLIEKFLKEKYDVENPIGISSQFLEFLTEENVFGSEYDREKYISYLKRYDFKMKNIGVLNTALAPLIDTWRKKIKDYVMARESEQYKLLIKHELYVDWL